MQNRHDCFIGRWVTFHEGHLCIIKQTWLKNHRPILILIMDTDEKPEASCRQDCIEEIMRQEKIPCIIQVIPPIASVNYGRNVGYDINYIEVPETIKKISGTEIRRKYVYAP